MNKDNTYFTIEPAQEGSNNATPSRSEWAERRKSGRGGWVSYDFLERIVAAEDKSRNRYRFSKGKPLPVSSEPSHFDVPSTQQGPTSPNDRTTPSALSQRILKLLDGARAGSEPVSILARRRYVAVASFYLRSITCRGYLVNGLTHSAFEIMPVEQDWSPAEIAERFAALEQKYSYQ